MEERLFLAHVGDIPEDVLLVAIGLNGQEFPLDAKTETSFAITEVVHPNNTCGYTLKVPFNHPVVIQQVKYWQNHVPHGSFSLLNHVEMCRSSPGMTKPCTTL